MPSPYIGCHRVWVWPDLYFQERIVSRHQHTVSGNGYTGQGFSNFTVHMNSLRILVKCRFWFCGSGQGSQDSASLAVPGDADRAGPQGTPQASKDLGHEWTWTTFPNVPFAPYASLYWEKGTQIYLPLQFWKPQQCVQLQTLGHLGA